MTAGISSLAGAASSTGTTASTKDPATLASNFSQFLTLLTTQLKNQNPLDPMDTNQFTQQLVQFAQVEQQLKGNDRLDSILASSKAASAASATSYVGKTVTTDGTTADLKDGAATWNLTPARAATKAVVTISDAKGNVVGTQTTSLAAGSQTFSWNGKNSSGLASAEGTYSIKVSATDATGANVAVATATSGTVDQVDLSGASPVLIVGSSRVPLASVTSIGLSTTSGGRIMSE